MGVNYQLSLGLNHPAKSSTNKFVMTGGARAQLDNHSAARLRRMDAIRQRCEEQFAGVKVQCQDEERLAERVRIAQDLHDTLLQGFFAVGMQLHEAVDHLPADYEGNSRFQDLIQMFDRVLEQGRLTVRGLRSPGQEFPSLGHAFAGVPSELGLPSGVGFRVVVEGRQRALRPSLREEAYRIGREAIVNAYRHSQAKEIEAEIEYRPAGLRIAVRDNGCGIDPGELRWERDGHWGLQGMRERAERIGARLRILSRVALGTEVELCVPSQIAFQI